MKKLPRPTASRTIRIWLPGRPSCNTACRNANDPRLASGADRAKQGRSRQMQDDRRHRKARRHHEADSARPRLPHRYRDQPGHHGQRHENLRQIPAEPDAPRPAAAATASRAEHRAAAPAKTTVRPALPTRRPGRRLEGSARSSSRTPAIAGGTNDGMALDDTRGDQHPNAAPARPSTTTWAT